MEHAERFRLAEDLCTHMLAAYPGVYGSTARRSDTPWPDLKRLFVVADESSTARFANCGFRIKRVQYDP